MKVIRECGRARNAQGWRKLGPRGLCGNSNLGQPPYIYKYIYNIIYNIIYIILYNIYIYTIVIMIYYKQYKQILGCPVASGSSSVGLGFFTTLVASTAQSKDPVGLCLHL